MIQTAGILPPCMLPWMLVKADAFKVAIQMAMLDVQNAEEVVCAPGLSTVGNTGHLREAFL